MEKKERIKKIGQEWRRKKRKSEGERFFLKNPAALKTTRLLPSSWHHM